MASASFHLPEEILAVIVNHLLLPSAVTIGERRDPDFRTLSDSDKAVKIHLSTLASLSRTCRALNRIVKPALYHTFPGARVSNARTFVKALAKDSVCADSVREIVIDKWEPRGHDSPVDRAPQSLDTQCLQYARGLRRTSSCYPVGLGSAIGAELESGRADVLLTILVLLCDHIEVLEASVPCLNEATQQEEFLRARSIYFLLDLLPVFKWTSESHQRYRGIKKFAMRLEKHSGTFGCTFATRMLLMPNLESFSAWRVSCSRLLTAREPGTTEHPWLGLKSVELHDCRIDNVMLGYLLQRAPNMRRINLQWAVQQYTLDFRTLAASLNTFGTQLESVRLDTRNNYCHTHDASGSPRIHEGREEPLGNLQQMIHLERLAVTPRALIGCVDVQDQQQKLVECLPASLNTLQIIGPTREDPSDVVTEKLFHQFNMLLHARQPMNSRLERVEFQCVSSCPDIDDTHHWRSNTVELSNLGPKPGYHCTLTRSLI
ncbi:hypothetical protein CERZMDRAFT_94422 [Cercospora zeae-maydis SCOH1-5]|uniref:F-box domain-containing protein n=1 Tax=Cercospora zeae-maydis SCOH1-5 TaxID=717836 RepID=A0A6A6FRW9_9PEZI|nr:hypothetical protein CERZMDRAFT_94422 [Cercospora zeae-maydis SCOH1-5]